VICSKVLVPEIETYHQKGWLRVAERSLWGLEEVELIDQVPVRNPTYHIGMYSSGFWARTENGWRVHDLERIRSGEFLQNRWYHIFLDMLAVVADLKAMHPRLKVKVYPHPFELGLLNQHGMVPPYVAFAQAAGFDVQLEGDNSLDDFYESKIGLSSQSTIVFDRMHYGIENYYYAGKEHWMSVEATYLGEYARYGFRDMADLRQKLIDSLDLAGEGPCDLP
jgi:hypothetical protein